MVMQKSGGLRTKVSRHLVTHADRNRSNNLSSDSNRRDTSGPVDESSQDLQMAIRRKEAPPGENLMVNNSYYRKMEAELQEKKSEIEKLMAELQKKD